MKIIESIYDRAFASDQEITEDVVNFYEKNPSELDLILDEEEFQSGFLSFFFLLGLAITIIARLIQVSISDYSNPFLDIVVLDVLSEVGIAIFGGTLVAYFIEFLKHKQFKKNQIFRERIKLKIEARKKPPQK